jgi:putative transposase
MSNALYDGLRYHLYNVIDYYNHESQAVEINTSIRTARLVRVFARLKETRSPPYILRVDNSREFRGSVFVEWC